MANNKARSAGVQAAGKRSVTSVTPKKTALTKDFTRSISHSKGRFVSIMALIALGTFALVGLFAAGPDMRATGTQYFGDYDVADISIISDYGLDEDDQAAIEEVSGVRQIEYGYFKDVVVEGTITSVRVYSAPTNVSQFEVTEGRLPEAEDEIALYSGLADDYDIGDAFVVEETADSLTGETTLTRTEFTVVGFVNSSEILSTLSMGQSTSGTGSLKGYAVASTDVFDSDVYMVARITFDDTQALNPYGTAYRDAVQAHKEELAELLADRPALRLAAVKADYQEGIDDAQAEVDDAKAEVEDARQQLADAKSQLDDAAAQISDAKQQIADSVAELLAAVAEGQDELDAAWAELQDAATQLSSARSQLAAAADQIAEAEEALADGEAQVAAAQAALDEAKAELDSSLDTLTASQAEYDEKLAEYEASYAEYEAGEDAYAEAYDQYEASLATYEQGVAALEEFESKFNTSPSELLSVLGQLEDEQVLSYLASAGILIEGSDVSAYLSQLQELADFEQSQATYEAQLDAAQEELAANRAALDAAKAQLAAAKVELDSAAASLEAGWATYNA